MPSSSSSSSSSSRRRHFIFFPFTCGCADSTSVSVSPLTSISSTTSSSSSSSRRRRQPNISSNTSLVSPLLLENPPRSDSDGEDAASFSDLLQELDELERGVIELGGPTRRREGWEESVAVEKETGDPVGELRRSMLAMVAGRAAVCDRDMAELLARFLAVNNRENHPLVIRAFERVWGELFSSDTPPPLWLISLSGRSQHYYYS